MKTLSLVSLAIKWTWPTKIILCDYGSILPCFGVQNAIGEQNACHLHLTGQCNPRSNVMVTNESQILVLLISHLWGHQRSTVIVPHANQDIISFDSKKFSSLGKKNIGWFVSFFMNFVATLGNLRC